MQWAFATLAVLAGALIVGSNVWSSGDTIGWALTVSLDWRDSLAFIGIVVGLVMLTRSHRWRRG